MPSPSWAHIAARRERLVEIITVQMLTPETTAKLLSAGEAAALATHEPGALASASGADSGEEGITANNVTKHPRINWTMG